MLSSSRSLRQLIGASCRLLRGVSASPRYSYVVFIHLPLLVLLLVRILSSSPVFPHHDPSCTPLDEEEETRKGTSLLSSAGYFADDEIIAAASESEDEAEAEAVVEEKAEDEEVVIAEDLVDAADQLDLLEADSEEEEEEEAEENDEKQEKEEPQVEEKTQAQKMEEFAQKYCVDNRIVRGHQWPAWKRGILESHVIAAGLKIPMDDVLIRIKQIAGERNT
jgi:hypothetical protein